MPQLHRENTLEGSSNQVIRVEIRNWDSAITVVTPFHLIEVSADIFNLLHELMEIHMITRSIFQYTKWIMQVGHLFILLL